MSCLFLDDGGIALGGTTHLVQAGIKLSRMAIVLSELAATLVRTSHHAALRWLPSSEEITVTLPV